MNIGEFFIKLGVVSDNGKVAKFNTVVKQGVSELKFLAIGATATAYAVVKMSNDLVNSVVGLENFNHQTGLSIDLLNQWQKAAQLSDVTLSYETISKNIQDLQNNLTELQFGGGNTQAFRWLGIDVSGQNAFQVLEKVRVAIKGIDNVTATNLLKKMGLSPNFINVLRLSRTEFEKLGKGAFLNEKQRNQAIKMGTALTRLKLELKEMKDQTMSDLAPMFIRAFERIGDLSRGINSFIATLSTSDERLVAFKATLLALAFVFAPISTAVIIAALAIEDLWTAIEGGDSISGETLKMLADPLFWQWGLEGTIGALGDLLTLVMRIGDAINGWALDGIKEIGAYFGFGGDAPAKSLTKSGMPVSNSSSSSSKKAIVSNVYNIQTSGDGQSLADQIASQQTRQFNTAFDELSGGTV